MKSLDGSVESLSSSYEERKSNIDATVTMARDLYKKFTSQLVEHSKVDAEKTAIKSRIESEQEQVRLLQRQLEEISQSEDDQVWKNLLEELKQELKVCTKEIKDCGSKIKSKSEEIDYVQFWVDGFSRKGIRSYMLDKVVPFINERLNHYLTILTDGGITARFNTVKQLSSGEYRDDFNLEILNKKASETYEGNSGGERRRVDLAVALAFNDFISARSGKRLNILLLDEVFEGIDAEGLYYVIKVLEDLARRKSSVFVITHRDELKSYFNDEIIVQRKDGLSIAI